MEIKPTYVSFDEDWEEQSQTRKALSNTPENYLR